MSSGDKDREAVVLVCRWGPQNEKRPFRLSDKI